MRMIALRVYGKLLLLGLSLVARGQWKLGLQLLWAPVGYWRFLPFAFVARELSSGQRAVLDVGSPKWLSVFLASASHRVLATDLADEKVFTRYAVAAETLELQSRYRAGLLDATSLDLPDASYDLIYSISVVEHIPDDGDSQALREFSRVLKPGGIVVIEVPYRTQPETVMARYNSRGEPLPTPEFYERHYDFKMLQDRLSTSALKLRERYILGEWLPLDPLLATPVLPRVIRLALLPLEPWFAALNYWFQAAQSSPPKHGRPLAALMIYAKV